MRNLLFVATAAVLAAAVFGATPSHLLQAQGNERNQTRRAAAPADEEDLETLHVQGNVYMLVGAGANITVQVGNLGVVVVDTGLAQQSGKVLAAIRKLSPRPIRYIINTHAHDDHTGGNAPLAAAGAPVSGRGVAVVGSGQTARAEIISHEMTLNAMSIPSGSEAARPADAWPTATFSADHKEFFTNDEGIQLVHEPAAHTNGDSTVFFRRSDVIATGDVYSTVSYPVIDARQGGTIGGVLAALNHLLAVAIAGEKTEGGTMLVPGHGRISDEADLVEYRDMVTIVRDRVQDMVKRGMTLEQVKAAKPTMEYDGLYGGTRGWTTDQFVEAVYRGLNKR